MAYSPKDLTTITTLEELRDWVQDELGFVSQHVSEQTKVLELTPISRDIERPREGNIIHADGTNFDPGFGAGPYSRIENEWVPLAEEGRDKVRSIVSFGAAGGFVDDTAAFDEAESWQNAEDGRTLLIPSNGFAKTGTYTITKNSARILGHGGLRASLITQNDDLDAFVASGPNPATDTNVGFAMQGICVQRNCGSSASTGVDLSLIGCSQFSLRDINLINAVNGLKILGGTTGFVDGLHILQNNSIVVRRVGSSLIKIGSQLNGSSITSHAVSHVFVNWDAYGLSNGFVDYGTQITGGDGLLFVNGHTGITGQACCLLNPTAITSDFFTNFGFVNVFFDGSAISSQSFAVQSGNAGQLVQNIRIANCEIGGATTHGLDLDYPTEDFIVSGNLISDNTNFGVILNGGASTIGATFSGNRLMNNGTDWGGNALNNASTVISQDNNPTIPSVQTTPTVIAGTGTFTTVSSTVNITPVGKLRYFQVIITITTNGTGGTFIRINSFGLTPLRNTGVHGYCPELGVGIDGVLATDGKLTLFRADGTFPTDGANGRNVLVEGFCEVA